jgi:hypothetical protein
VIGDMRAALSRRQPEAGHGEAPDGVPPGPLNMSVGL